ncbi:MAG: exosortase E/protease, VPEID-CTERM system [Myxococcales bacterium]|nr:MAG: exosortase E/protease, VPEID-CTERM system [Myxococcales bacterium]
MSEQTSQRWYLRPLVALLLLTVEYLTISLGLDAAVLLGQAGAWEGLGWTGLLGSALVAFGTALWILGGDQLRSAFARSAEAPTGLSSLARRLAFHVFCFAAFFAVSVLVFSEEGPPERFAGMWISLWVIGGAATVATLIPVAFGGLKVRALLHELRTPLALSAVLGLVAWGAGVAAVGLWEPLGSITLDAVVVTLEVLISPIYFEPSKAIVGTEEFSVLIAPICSGYEGIGLIIVFLAAYLVVFRERFRFPRVLVILPVAIAAVWLLNVARIVALILIGHAGYEDIAVGGFHSKAGWLLFCAVALGAVWVTQNLRWFARDPSTPARRIVNPSGPFLLPMLAVVSTALVTGLFVDDFDYLYPVRAAAGLLVLAWYRKSYASQLEHDLGGRSLWSVHAAGIGAAVYVLWIGLSSLDGPLAEAPPPALSELATPLALVWIIGRVAGSVVIAPLVEELAFRGFLLRRIIGSDFTKVPYNQWHWPAVLISSVAFAALHQQWIGGFAAGVLYAYAQKRRGLLSDAVLAHAVTNALIAVQVLGAGHWSLW